MMRCLGWMRVVLIGEVGAMMMMGAAFRFLELGRPRTDRVM